MSGAHDVTILGLGYVGFPITLMLAKAGLNVAGVDIDRAKMEAFAKGECPINEPKLQDIFEEVLDKGSLTFLDAPGPSDAFLIAVPTPIHPVKKAADLHALQSACESIVPHLKSGDLVIVNSTIPLMCCRTVVKPILEKSGLELGKDFDLCYCPERLYPGNIAHEIIHNDHIVGGYTPKAAERAAALYGNFVKGALLQTDDLTAEFCKLIENTYRDVNIALANELDLIAGRFDTDISHAIDLANRHPRVNLLKPGIGVGGHCLPIDPWFIAEMAPEESVLITAARRRNDSMPGNIAARIRRLVKDNRDARIGCAGVTYKPDVNDERESPAWEIVEELQGEGYDVNVYDPVMGHGEYRNFEHFAAENDVIVALVEHEVFREELDRNPAYLQGKTVLRF